MVLVDLRDSIVITGSCGIELFLRRNKVGEGELQVLSALAARFVYFVYCGAMATISSPHHHPDIELCRAVARLDSIIAESPVEQAIAVELAGIDLKLSKAVLEQVRDVLCHAANKREVSILARDVELTTSQAAELLGVSRPHIVKLLDTGELPGRKVGSHRRLRLGDVEKYRESQIKAQRDAANELVGLSQEMGLY
ncbi:helix-turn-helix domain-containing protein [Staphylococcus chromogenes]|nr:helix-turn-helix domain-containing protein [Staphylococcus chromogenes]